MIKSEEAELAPLCVVNLFASHPAFNVNNLSMYFGGMKFDVTFLFLFFFEKKHTSYVFLGDKTSLGRGYKLIIQRNMYFS